MRGALSDERSGLSFTIAAGPRQRRRSLVRVPWDSRPYFFLSDSRLLFSSPPTTHRTTLEVFDPASAREFWVWVLYDDRRSAGQSVLEWSTHLGLTTRSLLLSDSCGFVHVGRSLWREDGSVVYNCYWSSPAQSFSGLLLSQFRDFPFRRLLRLAVLRWRYSTPPPHGIDSDRLSLILRPTVTREFKNALPFYKC
jgi:hypothetical protein